MFLGDDVLAWIVLALGGALAFGSILAVLRPNPDPKDGELLHAPLGRSVAMASVGTVAAIWALASLLS